MSTSYYVQVPGAAEPAHLGATYHGWPFLFQAQPQWNPADSFSNWVLLATMGDIRDEYGHDVTFEALLASVMDKQSCHRAHEDSYLNHGFQFCLRYFG